MFNGGQGTGDRIFEGGHCEEVLRFNEGLSGLATKQSHDSELPNNSGRLPRVVFTPFTATLAMTLPNKIVIARSWLSTLLN